MMTDIETPEILDEPLTHSGERYQRPYIAVVGRPNVGKSTFINRIMGRRQTIVHDLPGVTRDRTYHVAKWQSFNFTLIDTGGIFQENHTDSQPFDSAILEQVNFALAEADMVLFLVDSKVGITQSDELVAQRLRQVKVPLFLVANKCDNQAETLQAAEFYALGLGEPRAVSALQGDVGVGNLLETLKKTWQKQTEKQPKIEAAEKPENIKVAFVGRPNVGKSSIVNALLKEQRSIVSDISGTTRDVIDTELITEKGGQFTLLDTAGIRKRARVDYGVEMFSVDRALRTISDCDVCVLVVDAEEGITIQEKRIAERTKERGKGLVVVVNKWDLIPNKKPNTMKQFLENEIVPHLPHTPYATVMACSALKNQRVDSILDVVQLVQENRNRRIQTSVVNQLIAEAVELAPPRIEKNRSLKINYATQAGTEPPTFVLFVNDTELVPKNYERYLEKRLRENIEFGGSPIKIRFKNKNKDKDENNSRKKSPRVSKSSSTKTK